MGDVLVVSAVRTPVGKHSGYLRGWTAPELLGSVLDAVMARIDLDPELVEDVITGCVYQVGEQGFTLARMGVLASRVPDTVPGIAVNRQCGSGLSAIQLGSAVIATGAMDVVIASGCELMSKYTIMSDLNGTLFNGLPMGNPFASFYTERYGQANQIVAAQSVADRWGITKEECQEFAIESHQRAHRATQEGAFRAEIQPTRGLDPEGREIVRDTDETIRPGTTREVLESLKIIPGTRWITSGLSSTITDGASAVVLMSERMVAKLGLTPMARVAASVVVGSDPALMLSGPIPATRKLLARTGLALDSVDLFEVNEAFAPVPLAWAKELGVDRSRLNVSGGALALGHPVGNSGCRLAVTALHALHRRKARTALVTLCTGGGMAPATLFERIG